MSTQSFTAGAEGRAAAPGKQHQWLGVAAVYVLAVAVAVAFSPSVGVVQLAPQGPAVAAVSP